MRRHKVFSNIKKVIGLLLLIIICGALFRMVLIVNERSKLAVERRDSAQKELWEVTKLTETLEAEAMKLSSDTGQKKALRERYGIVSENEGYLILLHNHPDQLTKTKSDWWKLW